MSSITNYLKMNGSQLEEEISKQNKKIQAAKETISLLKKLQIAEAASSKGGNGTNQSAPSFIKTE